MLVIRCLNAVYLHIESHLFATEFNCTLTGNGLTVTSDQSITRIFGLGRYSVFLIKISRAIAKKKLVA
jgi:hypothetical protein